MTSHNSPIWRRALALALALALAVAGTPARAYAIDPAIDSAPTTAAEPAADQATPTDEVAPVATEAPDEAQPSVASDDAVEKSVPSDSGDASDQQADVSDDEASSKDVDAPAAPAPAEAAAPVQVASAGAAPVSTQDDAVSVKMAIIGRDANGLVEYWSRESSYEVEAGSHADALTTRVLDSAGLTAAVDTSWGSYYLTSITSSDKTRTLAWDESTGRYWQLFVNGVPSDKFADAVELHEGDSVVWYYSAYGQSLTPSVNVRVIGPDKDGNDVEWLPLNEVTVPIMTSAADVTRMALDRVGLAADESVLIISAKEGQKLPNGESSLGYAQDASGNWSWWQFFVNDTSSNYYPTQYLVEDGDQITWYFSTTGASLPVDPIEVNPDAQHPALSSDWAGFKGNDGSGMTDARTPTKAVDLAWKVSVGEGSDWMGKSDPVIVNGDVYRAAGTSLYRIDGKTGAVKGSTALASSVGYVSRIQYADGLVLVPLDGGRLQAVSASTLETLWVTDELPGFGKARQQTNSAVTVKDGYAYLNTMIYGKSGYVVCVKVDTGEVRWAHENADAGYYWANMSISPAGLLVAAENGMVQLFDITSGLVLSSSNMATGCRGGVVYDRDAAYVVTTDGVLHRFDVGEGGLTEKGSVKFADSSTGTPTIEGSTAYVGGARLSATGGTGVLAMIDLATMTVKKSVTSTEDGAALPGDIKSTPLVSTSGGERWVYFTCNALPGGVYGVRADATEAIELWRPDKDDQQFCMSSVACDSDGNLYYANDSGLLFKIDAGTSAPVPAPDPDVTDGGNTDNGTGADNGNDNNNDNAGDNDNDDNNGNNNDNNGNNNDDNNGNDDNNDDNGSWTLRSGSVAPRTASTTTNAAKSAATPAAPATPASPEAKATPTNESTDAPAEKSAPTMPVWPFVGIGVAVVALAGALIAMRKRG